MEGTAAAARTSSQTATGMMLSARRMSIAYSFTTFRRGSEPSERESGVVQVSWEYIGRAHLVYEGEHPNRGVIEGGTKKESNKRLFRQSRSAGRAFR